MDVDGIHAQLLFPTFPRFAGTCFLDREGQKARYRGCSSVQRLDHDDWCASAPDRFIPMIIVPLWDPIEAGRRFGAAPPRARNRSHSLRIRRRSAYLPSGLPTGSRFRRSRGNWYATLNAHWNIWRLVQPSRE